MSTINDLLFELEERSIARNVENTHDQARQTFSIRSTTVSSFAEFVAIIGRYYNHHYAKAISRGTQLPSFEAEERAKTLLEQGYRRFGGDISMAFNDAQDGTNGGMRSILDMLADGLKQESTERYVNHVFDKYITPVDWGEKVHIIREFIAAVGNSMPGSINRHQPERYARDYKLLVKEFVEGLKRPSRQFRRF